MKARWSVVAILIGTHAFSGAAIAQALAPNPTGSTKPAVSAPSPRVPTQSAAPGEGPMVAPVKRIKPVMPEALLKDSKPKDTKPDAVSPVAGKHSRDKAKTSNANRR
jgi:hypothetical protein